MLGAKMQPYKPPEAGMPLVLVLAWAWADLTIGFMFRTQGLALEACREWYEVCSKREVKDVYVRSRR